MTLGHHGAAASGLRARVVFSSRLASRMRCSLSSPFSWPVYLKIILRVPWILNKLIGSHP